MRERGKLRVRRGEVKGEMETARGVKGVRNGA